MSKFTALLIINLIMFISAAQAGSLPIPQPAAAPFLDTNMNQFLFNSSQTILRGLEAADYDKLFLDETDFPKGYEKTQDSHNDDNDPNDRQYTILGGKRAGFNVWMAKTENVPVWRIVDIRIVFPSAEAAQKYVNSSLDYLSEGIKEDKTAPKLGADCHIFGPENPAAKMLGVKMNSYTYVFRQNNVVVKFFVAEGTDSPIALKPSTVIPLAQKILKRIS